MADWNGSFLNVDATSAEVLEMFCDAIRERLMAGGNFTATEAAAICPYPTYGGLSGTTKPFAQGTLTGVYWPSNATIPSGLTYQSAYEGYSSFYAPRGTWGHMQRLAHVMCLHNGGGNITYTIGGQEYSIAGFASSRFAWKRPARTLTSETYANEAIALQVGHPDGVLLTWSQELEDEYSLMPPQGLFRAAGMTAGMFTRKFPRRISTTSSTTYVSGGAVAEGHRAMCMADGRVYLRDGGAWVATTTVPDVVTTSGFLQPGDYVGHWVLEELRDLLNCMTHRWVVVHGDFEEKGGESSPTPASSAAGFAEAEAAYAAATSALGTAAGTSVRYSQIVSPTPTYNTQIMRSRCLPWVYSTLAGASVQFFTTPNLRAASGSAVEGVFDANGDTVSQTFWATNDTATTVAGGKSTGGTLQGSLSLPNRPTAPNNRRGYRRGYIAAVDFRPAYAYAPPAE